MGLLSAPVRAYLQITLIDRVCPMLSRLFRAAAVAAVLAVPLAFSSVAHAQTPSFSLTIKDHQFEPRELEVPSGKKFELKVSNQDKTPEEFESNDLHREKVIPGGGQITLTLGPLKPGRYEFFGEFNPQTARGFIVVK